MRTATAIYGGVEQRLEAQMTRAQALRLKRLSEEAYQPRQYARDLTAEEAEQRIAALQAENRPRRLLLIRGDPGTETSHVLEVRSSQFRNGCSPYRLAPRHYDLSHYDGDSE